MWLNRWFKSRSSGGQTLFSNRRDASANVGRPLGGPPERPPIFTGSFFIKLAIIALTAFISSRSINIYINTPAPPVAVDNQPRNPVVTIGGAVEPPPPSTFLASQPATPLPKGEYIVPGTAMPWLWQEGGLNADYDFSQQDGTRPVVIPFSKLGASAGQSLTIKYVGGEVDVGGIFPPGDGNGVPSQYSNGGDGSTGTPFPSAYMQPYPVNLGSLIGDFTDSNGKLIGSPFAVNDGPVTETIPAGASQLQLGIMDDRFSDNTGSDVVSVTLAHPGN